MTFLEEFNIAIDALKQSFPLLLYITGFTWLVFFVNLALHRSLFALGIIPRHILGIPGIFFSPFLHGNFNHLLTNTIFFLGIGGLLISQGQTVFIISSIWITVISGSMVWLFARSACHIGASALIIGYWSFILVRAYFGFSYIDVIAAIIGMYYFGVHLTASLLSMEKGVSFEGHFAGLIAGAIVGYFYPEMVILLNILAPNLSELIHLHAMMTQPSFILLH